MRENRNCERRIWTLWIMMEEQVLWRRNKNGEYRKINYARGIRTGGHWKRNSFHLDTFLKCGKMMKHLLQTLQKLNIWKVLPVYFSFTLLKINHIWEVPPLTNVFIRKQKNMLGFLNLWIIIFVKIVYVENVKKYMLLKLFNLLFHRRFFFQRGIRVRAARGVCLAKRQWSYRGKESVHVLPWRSFYCVSLFLCSILSTNNLTEDFVRFVLLSATKFEFLRNKKPDLWLVVCNLWVRFALS